MSEPSRAGRGRIRLGRRAEDHALAHLEAAGLTLVARNWKAAPRPGFGGHGGELDLVMRDGDVLVFVEVRATSADPDRRRAGFGGGAAYSVGHAKQRRLAVLAQLFLAQHHERTRVRFDVIALNVLTCALPTSAPSWHIRWYKNAFGV